jgi:hypothetical protein
MTPLEKILVGPARPAYAPGIKQAVKEKDTPLGFSQPSCFFCKATVTESEFAIHHEVPWCIIKEWLVNDYDFQISDGAAPLEAIAYAYNYVENPRAAHRECNSADGYIWRDREAARRHEQRVKANPEQWKF